MGQTSSGDKQQKLFSVGQSYCKGELMKAIDENRITKRLSLTTIIGNIALSVFKLLAGILGKSNAMVSDSIHSASDILATSIAYLGVRLSRKEADSEHEYGHDKIETLASLALGAILLATGLLIGKSGIISIIEREYENLPTPTMIALIASIVSICTKEGMFWYTRHYARILDSTAYMADAWHNRSDAFSSIGSLIGVAGSMMGYPVLDSIASIVICAFIAKTAISIMKDSISKMLDTSSGSKYEKELKDSIASEKDVIAIDLLHTRLFGNKVYVDLEIELDENLRLKESHAIAERIHDKLEKEFPNIKHVMIHVNPGRKEEAS